MSGDASDPRTAMEVVQAVFVSHKSRDTPGLVDLLDPDVQWHTAQGHPYAGNGPWHGPREVVEHVVNPVNNDWDNYQTRVDELIDAGDKVVMIGRYTGVHKATGRTLDAPVCTIYRVRDGLITSFEQYTDTAAFRHAMNLAYDEELP